MSSIDKDKARQINADDDDDIISITDSKMSELSLGSDSDSGSSGHPSNLKRMSDSDSDY